MKKELLFPTTSKLNEVFGEMRFLMISNATIYASTHLLISYLPSKIKHSNIVKTNANKIFPKY